MIFSDIFYIFFFSLRHCKKQWNLCGFKFFNQKKRIDTKNSNERAFYKRSHKTQAYLFNWFRWWGICVYFDVKYKQIASKSTEIDQTCSRFWHLLSQCARLRPRPRPWLWREKRIFNCVSVEKCVHCWCLPRIRRKFSSILNGWCIEASVECPFATIIADCAFDS